MTKHSLFNFVCSTICNVDSSKAPHMTHFKTKHLSRLFVCILFVLTSISLVTCFAGCARLQAEMPSEDFPPKEMSILPPEENNTEFATFWECIQILDDCGEYEIAYKKIQQYLSVNPSSEMLGKALDHVTRHLELLERPKNIAYAHLPTRVNMDDMSRSELRQLHFDIMKFDDARRLAKEFNLCGVNLKHYLQMIIDLCPVQDNEDFLALKKHAEDLKSRAIYSRCVFISYGVLSPCYAEAEKQLRLAGRKWYKLWIRSGSESVHLHKALRSIATPAHREWLNESFEDVRLKQFAKIWRRMKSTTRTAQFEDFKTQCALMNAMDPSKPVGEAAWWNHI